MITRKKFSNFVLVGVTFFLLALASYSNSASAQVSVIDGYEIEVFATNVLPLSYQGPIQLAFDSQGNLYFAPGGYELLRRIPAGTNVPEFFGNTKINDLDGVAVDSQDNIIAGGPPITKFDPNGNVLWQINCPIGNIQLITVDSLDNIYVGSLGTQICLIPPDGSGYSLLGGFVQPSEPVISPDGLRYLYVSQFGTQNNIIKIDLDGVLPPEVVVPNVKASQPVFDASGNFFIGNLSTTPTSVDKVNLEDGTLTPFVWGLTHVRGMAFAPNGDLYIGDSTDNIIYRVFRTTVNVPVDIKPQSCPNPLNANSNGVLPAAILGTNDFDVSMVVPSTIRLMGVSPRRSVVEDVATPFEPLTGKINYMDCNTDAPDNILDLNLKFSKKEVVSAIETSLGRAFRDNEVLTLSITGELVDGTPFVGEDVIIIKAN
ncbi:MAG: hypothetical protein Kow0089_01420 [Desulfobulbaceae bacterium]